MEAAAMAAEGRVEEARPPVEAREGHQHQDSSCSTGEASPPEVDVAAHGKRKLEEADIESGPHGETEDPASAVRKAAEAGSKPDETEDEGKWPGMRSGAVPRASAPAARRRRKNYTSKAEVEDLLGKVRTWEYNKK